MNLKENDKYTCDNEQTMRHLWESYPKSELKYLCNTEPDLTKILQDKNKCKEFQFLLKKMEKTKTKKINPEPEMWTIDSQDE